jgi:hypothetical protein
MLATPAGAATGCSSGEFPSTFAAQSGLKVACHTDAGTSANHIEIHDADNVSWHHGAARTVSLAPSSGNAITAGSTTIKFLSGKLGPNDVRRPINGYNAAKAAMFKGGTFITSVLPAACTTACTSATISQAAALTGGTTAAPISAKVEHTNNRVLAGATCSAGTNTLTSSTAKFVASDINKSVSGGPFSSGTFITSVTSTVATMNQNHTNACSATSLITIGAATYSGGSPVAFNADPLNMQLTNTATASSFTCPSTGTTLTLNAATVTDSGGFTAGDLGLPISIKGGTATLATTIKTVTSASVIQLNGTVKCPAGITATAGSAWVGNPGANAPVNTAAMMTLGAELNLSSTLVKTQDDCANATYEGFMVVGGWQGPGTFLANASSPRAAVGQVVFPTSVISFNGFVVPKKGGDSVDANPHYNFSFPLLPTSLAVCATPLSDIQLAFAINPTTESAAPFLPTGSGNPGDPSVRQLLPETGTFSQTMELISNPSTVISSTSSNCTIAADTAIPGTPCGDG